MLGRLRSSQEDLRNDDSQFELIGSELQEATLNGSQVIVDGNVEGTERDQETLHRPSRPLKEELRMVLLAKAVKSRTTSKGWTAIVLCRMIWTAEGIHRRTDHS